EYCLVMEYVDGIPIYDHDRLRAAGYNLNEIGEKMLDNYATQILEHGFFHADPHPGNIIVRNGRVVYIDLGIMGQLSPAERAGFSTIIEAVGEQDASKLKDALLSFAVQRDNSVIDHSRFLADLDLLLTSYASCDVSNLDIGQLLSDVMGVTRMSRVTLPSSVTNVSRGIVTIEGTIADFIPNESIASIINDHIMRSGNPLDRAQDLALDMLNEMRKATEGITRAAGYSGEALRMLTRGQLKTNMEMLGSDSLITSLAKIMNRLTIGIIIAGLFIGSSLYARYGGEQAIFGIPLISFFGFLGAFILSVWVVFDIWRRR
ncbi:MAG TPA: ABC transporter, partial [Eggerthellaceae bacterium]|nr:ABC transporter [Eggerthellaceae bacterium]